MKFLLLVLFIACASNKKWEVKDDIKNPESVYYYAEADMVFVSNVNGDPSTKDGKGHISLLSKEGKVIDPYWIRGLNAPKGMRASRDVLWIADIDQVHAINIKDKKIVKTFKVKGAKLLNDIAIDGDTIYVSDTFASKIFKISNGKVSTFANGRSYESPNGLYILDGKLYVASWGYTKDWSTKKVGRLYSIDLKTRKREYITKAPLGNLDGLEVDEDGNFIVSDWVAGKVYEVSAQGDIKEIYQGKKGLADIGIILNKNLILIPMMLDNEVLTLPLKN